ncbi:MAG: tyrosine-type recombinase/integrase [Ferrimicrobium sp.]
MSSLAPTMEAFFSERLVNQKQVSEHTIGAYADTFRLLLGFIGERTGKSPSALDFADIDAPAIGAFLDYLEHVRGNATRTRNARLAAIHSLFNFAALRHPEHAALIQRVLAIPTKRYSKTDVSFLEADEINALIAAPNRDTWIGRRDHALLVTAIQSGLRVSELIGLSCVDVYLGKGAYVRCVGKGRKQRCTPLTSQTVSILRVWMRERGGEPAEPLFPTSRGHVLSRDAVEFLVAKYARIAQLSCSTLGTKTITPHTLRHSAAMNLLRSGVSTAVIAMWLGHESPDTTQIYLHADLTIKERALDRTAPFGTKPGRYQAPDALLAFLESL